MAEVKAILPQTVKTIAEKDDSHRDYMNYYEIRAPSGAGLGISAIPQKEHVTLHDHIGNVLIGSWAPDKGSPEKESPNTESKLRPEACYCRADNSASTQTSPGPSVLKNGQCVMGSQDVNGSGWMVFASNDGGSLTIQANSANGSVSGPSIILDSKGLIVLTAGDAQITINGQKGQFETNCKSIILEKPRIPVEKTHQKFKDFVKNQQRYFSKSCSGGGCCGGDNPGTGQDSGSSSDSSGSPNSGQSNSGGSSVPNGPSIQGTTDTNPNTNRG